MVIKKIRIGNFGKFANKEFEFSDGLNIIYGENEAGKSTIHAFVKAMLFGIEIKRGSAGKDDVYSRFLPWDVPGAFSGSLDFEHDGVNYRIARTFLKNAKSCTCTNLDTGKEINLADEKISSLIPALNESNYCNTVIMGQQSGKTEKVLADNVNNYIANLALAKTGEVDIPGALERLKKKTKEINAKRAETDEQELLRWQEELEDGAAEIEENIADLKHRLDGEKENANRLNQSIDELKTRHERETAQEENESEELVDYSIKIDEISKECEDKLKTLLSESETKIKELENTARMNVAELDKARQKKLFVGKSEYDSCKKLVKERRVQIDEKRSEIDTSINKLRWEGDEKRKEISNIRKEREELEPKEMEYSRKKGSFKNSAFIGIAVLVIGGILAYLFSDKNKLFIGVGLGLMVIGVVVLLFGMIKGRENDMALESIKKRLDEIGTNERKLQSDVMETDRQSNILEDELKKYGLELDELKSKESTAEHVFEVEKNDAESVYATSKGEQELKLERALSEEKLSVERKSAELKATRDQEIVKLKEKESKEREQRERNKLIKANKEEQFNIELVSKQNELEGCNRLITANEEQMAGLSEKADDIYEKLENINKKLFSAREIEAWAVRELEAIEMAKSTISRMSELIYDSFGKQLNDMLSSLTGKLTNGRYTNVVVNRDLSIKFMSSLDYKSTNGLSAGTMEQLYLALRLSIGELFFGDTKVPVILDEPFAYYDEGRMQSALENMASLDKQVLLFSCRRAEQEALDELNVDYNAVNL